MTEWGKTLREIIGGKNETKTKCDVDSNLHDLNDLKLEIATGDHEPNGTDDATVKDASNKVDVSNSADKEVKNRQRRRRRMF